ncbi:MAG: DUF4251 domain-containing protein [Bacteroidetes bacterium]|nr:DUF4251 domain-containing protein [Bacteroidota bacterium]
MKTISAITLSFLMLLCSNSLQAQKNAAVQAALQNAVDSQRYTFYAQFINPMQGGQRYLTTEYTLKVSPDTVQCDLPFIGRAYTAPIGGMGGGINFTSTQFTYTIAPRKKGGGWDVLILPKDNGDVTKLLLTIQNGGTATLQVISNNRESIGYTGYVMKKK